MTHRSTLRVRISWLVALQILLLTTAAAARKCSPGSFDNGKTCKKCRPGTYQNQAGSTSCKKCPAGTVTRVSGVTSEFLCRPCPDDSTSIPGTRRCFKCPRGQIRVCEECKHCPPGSYFNSCECQKCSPDSFSTKPNRPGCIDCPPGQRATPDRMGCVDADCPAGTEYDFDKCETCMFNSFRNLSMPKCQPCPPKTVPLNYGIKDKCGKCPPGEYLTDLFVPSFFGLPECEKCPPGSSTKGFGKAFCRRDGKPCPKGTFEDFEGDCDVCEYGFRYNPKKKRCVKCDHDEYSEGGIPTKCKKCAPGGIGKGEYCDCPKGQELRGGRCRPCLPGTHRHPASSACIDCYYDEFSGPGATECTKCPKGSLSLESGGKKCKKVRCKKGFIQPPPWTSLFGPNICISVRTGCPKGLFFISDSGTWILCGDKKGNVVCPKGSVFDKVNSCIRCSRGWRVAEAGDGSLTCKECPSSKPVSRGGASRKCRKCKKGFEASEDKSKCVCPPGKFITKNGKCRKKE